MRFARPRFASPEAVSRSPETLRPQRGQLRNQPFAMLVKIDQSEGCQMPVVILQDAAIAYLGITEDTLQDAKGPLHLGSNSRLRPVLALLVCIHALLGFHAPLGHVLRLVRGLVYLLCLPLVARIAPGLLLIAVE